MGGRAEAEHVEDQRLVVALPAVAGGSRAPASSRASRCAPAVHGPPPVDAPVERVGQRRGSPRSRRRRASKYAAAVSTPARSSAVSMVESSRAVRAPAGLHVEEVVVEALVAGGVGLRALRALRRRSAAWPARARRVRRGVRQPRSTPTGYAVERHPDGGDARRPAPARLVADEPVARVGLVEEVREALALELVEDRIGQDSAAVPDTRPHLRVIINGGPQLTPTTFCYLKFGTETVTYPAVTSGRRAGRETLGHPR